MLRQGANIVLIGPALAGKTTQGKLLASALDRQSVSLDDVAHDYYEKAGFGPVQFEEIKDRHGYLEAYRRRWPALAFAARHVARDYTDCVIDFGAGHSHYEDEALFDGVADALSGARDVILVLPTADRDRSVSILRERSLRERKHNWIFDGYDFLDHWVNDDCNYRLSTTVIYTDGKSPEETRDEILRMIKA